MTIQPPAHPHSDSADHEQQNSGHTPSDDAADSPGYGEFQFEAPGAPQDPQPEESSAGYAAAGPDFEDSQSSAEGVEDASDAAEPEAAAEPKAAPAKKKRSSKAATTKKRTTKRSAKAKPKAADEPEPRAHPDAELDAGSLPALDEPEPSVQAQKPARKSRRKAKSAAEPEAQAPPRPAKVARAGSLAEAQEAAEAGPGRPAGDAPSGLDLGVRSERRRAKPKRRASASFDLAVRVEPASAGRARTGADRGDSPPAAPEFQRHRVEAPRAPEPLEPQPFRGAREQEQAETRGDPPSAQSSRRRRARRPDRAVAAPNEAPARASGPRTWPRDERDPVLETEALADLDEFQGAVVEVPLEDEDFAAAGPSEPVLEEDGQLRRGRRRGGRRRRERRERARLRSEAPGATFPVDPADRSARGGPAPQEVDDGESALALEAIPGEDDDLIEVPVPGHRGLARVRHGAGPHGVAPVPAGAGFKPVHTRRVPSEEGLEPQEDGGRRRRGRASKSAAASLVPRNLPRIPRDQTILVNAADAEETRVVVVEKGRIVDLQMTVERHKSFVNDIYRGRVVNLESAIGAAFVDFGEGRNGFLHASDVMDFYGDEDFALERLLTARTEAADWADKGVQADEVEESGGAEGGPYEGGRRTVRPKRGSAAQKSRRVKRRNITDLLQKGQLVVVQITKDAIGDKGPTLTTYISIPGRYLVLMPSLQRTGVSRKIEDERERRRLKKILQDMEIPDGMGVIVRTAGIGKTAEEIQRDLDYLLAVWGEFSKQLVLGRMPAPLYQESDVAIRTMRDLFSTRTEAVIVDDPKVYEQMLEFTRRLMPEHEDRVRLHDGQKPLYHTHSIEQDFERIFARRVELPSGGSIVIDQTEALVAIDVNSGRTRDEGADFEDIALKTNLEAAPEIARQIKLRDMGGILVVDFIDMLRPSSRRQVEKVFTDCLDQDRARSKVGRISQFGLLELTRQRLGPGLSKLVYESCPVCKGSGRRRTAQSRAQAVLRRLAAALAQKGFSRIDVLAHQDTIEWLEQNDREELDQLREESSREIVLQVVDNQAEDSVFHYLRADGREVRPGGRRKR